MSTDRASFDLYGIPGHGPDGPVPGEAPRRMDASPRHVSEGAGHDPLRPRPLAGGQAPQRPRADTAGLKRRSPLPDWVGGFSASMGGPTASRASLSGAGIRPAPARRGAPAGTVPFGAFFLFVRVEKGLHGRSPAGGNLVNGHAARFDHPVVDSSHFLPPVLQFLLPAQPRRRRGQGRPHQILLCRMRP